VIPVGDSTRSKAYEITAMLRKGGLSADMDLMRRNMGKNFKYADSVGAENVIIVGEKELETGSANVRNMRTGEQVLVGIHDLVRYLSGQNDIKDDRTM
jgi:histidyl-tRNA synthetase